MKVLGFIDHSFGEKTKNMQFFIIFKNGFSLKDLMILLFS